MNLVIQHHCRYPHTSRIPDRRRDVAIAQRERRLPEFPEARSKPCKSFRSDNDADESRYETLSHAVNRYIVHPLNADISSDTIRLGRARQSACEKASSSSNMRPSPVVYGRPLIRGNRVDLAMEGRDAKTTTLRKMRAASVEGGCAPSFGSARAEELSLTSKSMLSRSDSRY